MKLEIKMLVQDATFGKEPTDSRVNDALAYFRHFLEELGVPLKCFSSSSRKHIWCFSREGKDLFIDFHKNRDEQPYFDIRKGSFSLEYRDTYSRIIDRICANLDYARTYAKKEQLCEYPTADIVRTNFWIKLLSETDYHVFPGVNCLLSATSDPSYVESIQKLPNSDIVYIDRIIYAEFIKWASKWKNIGKEMLLLRKRDLAPTNMRSPKDISALIKVAKEITNELPNEPTYTAGISLDNTRIRQQERDDYEDAWLDAMIHIYHSGVLPPKLEFNGPAKTSAEIYQEALSKISPPATDLDTIK